MKGCRAVTRSERRDQILKILNRRRFETMPNLAQELGVSWLTIYRDIHDLSMEHPTLQGVGGGVYLDKDYHLGPKYLSTYQQDGLERILPKVDRDDQAVIRSVLTTFARPGNLKKSC